MNDTQAQKAALLNTYTAEQVENVLRNYSYLKDDDVAISINGVDLTKTDFRNRLIDLKGLAYVDPKAALLNTYTAEQAEAALNNYSYLKDDDVAVTINGIGLTKEDFRNRLIELKGLAYVDPKGALLNTYSLEEVKRVLDNNASLKDEDMCISINGIDLTKGDFKTRLQQLDPKAFGEMFKETTQEQKAEEVIEVEANKPEVEIVKTEELGISEVDSVIDSITNLSESLKNGISSVEQIDAKIKDLDRTDINFADLITAEDYFKAQSKNYAFGDKEFDKLTDEEKQKVKEDLAADLANDPNKVKNIITDKYKAEKKAIIDNLMRKATEALRLAEDLVDLMQYKKDSTNKKVQRNLQDIAEIEREIQNGDNSRKAELDELYAQNKKYNAEINTYQKLIDLGNSYGTLTNDIKGKLANENLELKDELERLDSLKEEFKKAKTVEETKEETQEKEEEETKAQTTQAATEATEEEKKEEDKTSEDKKEENKKEEDKYDPSKYNPSYTAKGPSYANLSLNRLDPNNHNARRKVKATRTAMIAVAAVGGITAAAVVLPPLIGSIGLGIGPAILPMALSNAAGIVDATVIFEGALLGAKKFLQQKRENGVRAIAHELNADMLIDYNNAKAVFGKKNQDGTVTVFNNVSEIQQNYINELRKAGIDETELEQNWNNQWSKSSDKFTKIIANDDAMDIKSLGGLINSGRLADIYNRFGGLAVSKSAVKPENYDNVINNLRNASEKDIDERIAKLENLLKNQTQYNISPTVFEIIKHNIEKLNEMKNKPTLKENAVGKMRDVREKLGERLSFIKDSGLLNTFRDGKAYPEVNQQSEAALTQNVDTNQPEPVQNVNQPEPVQNENQPEQAQNVNTTEPATQKTDTIANELNNIDNLALEDQLSYGDYAQVLSGCDNTTFQWAVEEFKNSNNLAPEERKNIEMMINQKAQELGINLEETQSNTIHK